MRLTVSIFLAGLLLQFLFPWWILAVTTFLIAAWFASKSGQAFLAGFSGIALTWLVVSLFYYFRNEGMLASRVSELFMLPHSSLLIVVAIIISGLVGGIAALSGYYCRRLF